MKKTLLASLFAVALPFAAMAQSGTNVPPALSGLPGSPINTASYAGNTDTVGFSEQALSTALVAGGTTQLTATQVTTPKQLPCSRRLCQRRDHFAHDSALRHDDLPQPFRRSVHDLSHVRRAGRERAWHAGSGECRRHRRVGR